MPSDFIFSTRKAGRLSGFRTARVCWNRKVLLADPPPLARKRNR